MQNVEEVSLQRTFPVRSMDVYQLPTQKAVYTNLPLKFSPLVSVYARETSGLGTLDFVFRLN